MSTFTPIFDIIAGEYGLITAAVFGRIWRYSQYKGVCTASHDRIARDIGVERRTVIRHISILAKDGYISDLSPGVRNRPHHYRITQKGHDTLTITGVTESDTTLQTGVTKSDLGVTESDSGCDSKSHEDTKNIQVNKQYYYLAYDAPIPTSAKEAQSHPAIQVFTKVTGKIPRSNKYKETCEYVRLIAPRFMTEELFICGLSDGKEWREWRNRYPKSLTNPGWLEWVFNIEMPEPKGTRKPKNDKPPVKEFDQAKADRLKLEVKAKTAEAAKRRKERTG